MIRITLGKTPPSTQTLYRHKGHIVYMTKKGKDIKEGYISEIKSQYKNKLILTPVSVVLELYFPNKAKRDLDNFNKIVLDACSNIVWKDDSQIEELIIRKFLDVKKPRVELIIREI